MPGFAVGGVVGSDGATAPIMISIQCEVNAEGIVVKGLKSSDGRKVVVDTAREHVARTGMAGLAGDVIEKAVKRTS